MWQIFNRRFLHLRGGSSVTVLFDKRITKSKLPYNLRVRCIYCAGAASNRGLCSHEQKCVELVSEGYREEQNILSTEGDEEILEEVESTQENRPHSLGNQGLLQTAFESRRTRRLFVCRG